MRDRVWSITVFSHALLPSFFCLYHVFVIFWFNFIVIYSCLLYARKWRLCCSVWKTYTPWDNVVVTTASLKLKEQREWCKMSQCSPRLWAACSKLKAFLCNLNYHHNDRIVVSYRFLILSVHFIILVTLFFFKVIGGRKPVFMKQLTAVLVLHLVGLTSAFLNKAEQMTVIRFVHSKVLEAVSHQCTVCQSCIGVSPVCLFASRLTVCLRCLWIVQNVHE